MITSTRRAQRREISGIGLVQRLQRYAKAEITCEDNLKFMRRLPDESMNLIVTSPPYNIGKSYEKRTSQGKYLEDQAACIAEAVRLLSPKGSICWQVGNHIDVIVYSRPNNYYFVE